MFKRLLKKLTKIMKDDSPPRDRPTPKPRGFPEPPQPPPTPPIPEKPYIVDGTVRKAVSKIIKKTSRGSTYSLGFEIDEEHPITIKYRRLEKLRHAGMLFESVPQKFIKEKKNV